MSQRDKGLSMDLLGMYFWDSYLNSNVFILRTSPVGLENQIQNIDCDILINTCNCIKKLANFKYCKYLT